MDTKTPPIPLKHQEKTKSQTKRIEKTEEVTLPPLTSNGATHGKSKNASVPWTRGPPQVLKNQEQLKKRPYRILHIGATPLMHACQQGDRSRVLRLLKEQEETVGYRDRTLRSALHYCMDAATGGAVASAAPELVNSVDAEGHTPLHLAVIAGDTQLVAVLLANGADVNAKDLEGHSVLHWATVCGEAECVRLVLAAGARPTTPDLRGGSPLHYAAQCCGAAVTAELSVPKKIGLKVLQTLLEFGADVNAKDEDGRQPILWAASAGSVEAVLALARTGGSAAAGATDKDGLTALHCAASRGHARCVEALVNLCAAQPDHVDDNGCSALHYAATLGHADATALLLRLGADPNRQDRKGRTPALCAAAKGQLETLKILAQRGGSLHARTVRGTGVAHEAVLSGRIELIEWLAKKKPSTLDVATHDGRTPLHVAALHGYLDACKVLLDHGARINVIFRTSKSGPMTPLDAALYRGHRDCGKLIQMHGGMTANHLRTHKTAPNRVFAAKLRVKQRASSSGSESSSGKRHREPEIYIEERWIERRTRRRASPRRHEDSRRGSRSFSEEEIRLSKSSRRDRQRRARSESARYEDIGLERSDKHCRKKSIGKKHHSKHEYGESSSELDDSSDDVHRRSGSREDDRSLSDDSLEVVVVRRSLEKKLEKVSQYSGKKSKTPREMSKETRVTETKRKSSRRKSKTAHSSSRTEDSSNNTGRKVKNRESASEESAEKTDVSSRWEKKEQEKSKRRSRFGEDITDSTSQDTVERVTVTALVHKDQAPDTPKASTTPIIKETKDEESTTNIEELLEKADEMQNALLTKAADLKKDFDEIRRQKTEEDTQAEVDKDADKSTYSTPKKGRTEDESESESISDDSQREISRLQSQPTVVVTIDENKVEGETVESQGPKNIQHPEEKVNDNNDGKEDSTSPESQDTPTQDKSSLRSKSASGTEVSDTDKDSRDETEKSEKSKNGSARITSTSPKTTELSPNIAVNSTQVAEKSQSTPEKSNEITDTPGETRINAEKVEKASTKPETGIPETKPKIVDTEDTPHHSRSSNSAKSIKKARSRPSTGKGSRSDGAALKSPARSTHFEDKGERSQEESAIVAVLESPEWDEEDEAVAKEIRDVVGDAAEEDTEPEHDDSLGVLRVLPSTSDESTPRRPKKLVRVSKKDTLPRVDKKIIASPRGLRPRTKQRRDSGGRDSGIEPSPRVSKIPKRTIKCYPNTEKHQTLNIDTVTRDVQISLRRYHLERKIFFQLMELKRLQIRHGRANEQVLVKRQVDVFHKAGMTGPTLGVAKYDQAYTFKDFETFLYEQLRRLQKRPATPDWCTEAKQCTQKTHRCHHATSAYTSVPIYTYLGGGSQERDEGTLLPRIESRGKGQMTVEVTRGEEKQVIALPAEKLDRTKRYFVTFTVRGDSQESDMTKTSRNAQRNTKSV